MTPFCEDGHPLTWAADTRFDFKQLNDTPTSAVHPLGEDSLATGQESLLWRLHFMSLMAIRKSPSFFCWDRWTLVFWTSARLRYLPLVSGIEGQALYPGVQNPTLSSLCVSERCGCDAGASWG